MVTLQTFDLCKQLHELKPDWQTIGSYVIKSEGDEPHIDHDEVHRTCYDWAPEYTIDYLLEKLPNRIVNGADLGMLMLSARQGSFRNGWVVFYENDAGYPMCGIDGVAENPLDAVLKLTIELAKRAEL